MFSKVWIINICWYNYRIIWSSVEKTHEYIDSLAKRVDNVFSGKFSIASYSKMSNISIKLSNLVSKLIFW